MTRNVRAAVGATARRLPLGIVSLAIPEPQLGSVFALFEREGAPPVSLFSGYRNMVKRSWVNQWWPTTCLLAVWSRARPAEVEPLVRELTASRALPRPVSDFAAAALELQRAFPEYLHVSSRWDDALGCPVVEPIPGEDELCACAAEYRALAGEIDDLLTRHGVRLTGARVLDLGCGTGYLGFALAGRGAGEVIGVDLDLEMASNESARGRMMELLAGDRADVVSIRRGDGLRGVLEHLQSMPSS